MTQRVFSFSVLCAAAIAIGGATAPRACAQPSKAKSSSAVMLREAYQLTRVADSESDYARIIALCDEGANSAPATGSTAQYAAKLKRWALEARGESRLKEGRAAEALVDFDEAHRLDPRNPRVLLLRGVCQARLGRPDEALVDLDKSIELHHGDARSFVERGEVRYALGRYAEAARDFDQALRLKPRDTAAHVGRGHARYRLKQFAAAAQDYTTALATRRQDAPLYTQRGQAYAELGRYTEAANDFRRAMRIDPNYGKAFQSAAWLMATCPDPRHRDDLLAIELSKRSIDLDGKSNPRYLETLAAALANAGYFDEARQVQEKAMEKTSEKSLARSAARRDLFAAGRPYREGRTMR